MTMGTGLFLFAVGAILAFAVRDSIEGVDLETVGYILMAVGIVGAIAGAIALRRSRAVADPRYRDY
jgi:uncharacterized protein DUF6458